MIEEKTLIATLGFILGLLFLLILSRYLFLKRSSLLSQAHLSALPTAIIVPTPSPSPNTSAPHRFIVVDTAEPSVYGIDVDWRADSRRRAQPATRRVVVLPSGEVRGRAREREEEFLPVYEERPPGYEKVVEGEVREGGPSVEVEMEMMRPRREEVVARESIATGDSIPSISVPVPETTAPQPTASIPPIPEDAPPSYSTLQPTHTESPHPSHTTTPDPPLPTTTPPTAPPPAATRSTSTTRSSRRGRFGGYFDVGMQDTMLNGRYTGGLSS